MKERKKETGNEKKSYVLAKTAMTAATARKTNHRHGVVSGIILSRASNLNIL